MILKRYLLSKIFILLMLALSARVAVAGGQAVYKDYLDNGLTVLIEEIPSSPVVCLYAMVKTGSAMEGRFLGSGITHFMEHMLFKGTTSRGVGEIAQDIHSAGGVINASTSRDYTLFNIQVPSENFDIGLDVLSDMLINTALDKEEFEKERQVVLAEIKMYEDSPDFQISQMAVQTLYRKHPYRYPILGHQDVLKSIELKDMMEYYRTVYVPNNIVLVVTGNVNTQEAFAKIQQAFSDFKRKPQVMRHLPKEPKQVFPRYLEREYPTDLARVRISFPTVGLYSKDRFALDILAHVLGIGESSRLYLEVFRKRNLVYSISASHFAPVDPGSIVIGFHADEDNIKESVEVIRQQIELIKRRGISSRELNKIKKRIKSNYYLNRQSAASAAFQLAYDQAMAGDYRFSSHYINKIQSVSAKDVQAVAQKYLKPEKENLVVLRPLRTLEEEPLEFKVQDKTLAQKTVLENGIIVLTRPDHRLPLVSAHILLKGGQRQEDIALPGVCHLVSRVLDKGTRKWKATEIAQSLEERGIRLNAFCSKDVLGLSLECLSEDLNFGLDLAKEILLNAIFPEPEINQQKDVVRARIRAKQDSIFQLAAQELRQILFAGHPFGNEEEGSLKSLDQITRQDLIEFYGRMLDPSRMIITIFGDIKKEEAVSSAKRLFGGIVPRESELAQHIISEITQKTVRDFTFDKKQSIVLIGFQGVGAGHQDRWGLDVLSALIGSFNGRMFRDIRDQYGWAYSLGGSASVFKDESLIYFYILTNQEHAQDAQKKIEEMIVSIQQQGITEQELDKIKTYVRENYQARLETISSQGIRSALDEIYGLGFRHYQDHADVIDQITIEDIKRLSQEYLDLERAVIIIGHPKD